MYLTGEPLFCMGMPDPGLPEAGRTGQGRGRHSSLDLPRTAGVIASSMPPLFWMGMHDPGLPEAGRTGQGRGHSHD